MWASERQAKILEILNTEKRVVTLDLVDLFDVSRETIRRDLLDMETAGALHRVHGGAICVDVGVATEPDFAVRMEAGAEYKAAIGAATCDLIGDGATVFVDAGTTTRAFAHQALRKGSLKFITNSIEIAQMASGSNAREVLLLGGRPHKDVPATYGELTLSEIDRFHADFAVLSPVGLHPTRGASYYELHEAEVARAMIRRSARCIMLCHSPKIGVESRVAVCRPEEIDHIVTDELADKSLRLPRGQVHFTSLASAVSG